MPWFPLACALGYLVLDYTGNSVIASLPGAPESNDPTIATFLAENRTVIAWMAMLIALSGVCLGLFAQTLRRRLPAGPAGELVAGCGVAFATLSVVQALTWWSAIGDSTEDHGKALWNLVVSVSVLSTLPAGPLLLATALTVRRHRSGPTWIWRGGLPLAALVLVPFMAWLTLKLFPLWAVAVGMSLRRQGTWAISTATYARPPAANRSSRTE